MTLEADSVARSLAAVGAAEASQSLGVALGALCELTGAQRGFIAVRRDDGALAFPAARAFAALDVTAPAGQLSKTILEAALRGAAPLVVDDAQRDARFAPQASVQALALKAVLVVPLAAQGAPFGVLYLDNPLRAAAFGDAERRAAEELARLAGPLLARDLEIDRLRRASDARLVELRERCRLDGLLGESAAMTRVLELCARVADKDATVLVTGETGTGKELVAEALHASSRRATGPFIAVNCGALPSELVESELFGHERGAFTGAVAARTGRFEAADGGTLFLDEIGELPAAAQAKLLRVLERGTFERVGASRPSTTNVRLVAATHRDLDREVAAGRFRADLVFRLKILEIRLPPLRERQGDVARLAAHFLDRFARRHGSPARALDPGALAALEAYGWPGNVRELRNVIERAVLLGGEEPVVGIELLPPEIAGAAPAAEGEPGLKAAVRAFKRRFVERALAETGGHPAATAERLGVHPKYLYQLLRELGIERG